MAAGMGSRFGGLKQITPIDGAGHAIIDYSLFDAYRAGFRRVAFIIKRAIESDFRAAVGERMEKYFEVSYVFQELDCLPDGFFVPGGREKPWGTGHAVACCRNVIDAPFAVINADDFYGASAFQEIFTFLTSPRGKNEQAMVGYRLADTVTDSGYVSRGRCEVEDGLLRSITELTHIEKRGGGIEYLTGDGVWRPLSPETTVSMNFWGFGEEIPGLLWDGFSEFLSQNLDKNPLKCEYYLPSIAERLIAADAGSIHVLHSCDRWYGMTYREDLPELERAVGEMRRAGKYPAALWGARD